MITREATEGIPAQYRQGDIFLERIASIPESAESAGTHILEHGTVTGHYHAIAEEKGTLLLERDRQYLGACFETPLTHQTHGHILLPPGNYMRRQQLTYDYLSEMAKQVID